MVSTNGFFRRKFEQTLENNIPSKMKRMCLIASLTANIRNTYQLDQNSLKVLNETMSLVQNEDSLLFPVVIGKKIWHDQAKGFETIRALIKACDWSKEQVSKICTAIMELIPSWLWYGDRDTIATDVELLLRHHKTVLHI